MDRRGLQDGRPDLRRCARRLRSAGVAVRVGRREGDRRKSVRGPPVGVMAPGVNVRAIFTAAIAVALLQASWAGAEQPKIRTGGYSPYELQTLRNVEKLLATTVDPQPEGKTI